MKRLLSDKRYNGIFCAVTMGVLFISISHIVRQVFDGVSWFLFSSLLRLIFGIVILVVGKQLYGKTVKVILCFDKSKAAIIAGLGVIVYFIYYLIDVSLGIEAITGLTLGLFISQILLQQLTTGFYEELNYRFLILEGFFYGKRSIKNKLIYAFISSVFFGLAHVITGWNTYTFLYTGIIGFAFAVMYLKSRNIVVPMVFHFVYDIIANLTGYVQWNNSVIYTSVNSVFDIVYAIMFLLSFIILIKEKKQK